MHDAVDKLNVLLIEDNPHKVARVRDALKGTGLSFNLQTIGAGTSTLAYLRQSKPYADAPIPDLVFFDFSEPRLRYFRLLDEVKADTTLASLPIVLLTSEKSEALLAERYEQRDECTIFSPVALENFLHAMTSLDLARFLHALRLIEQLGFVLVRLPYRASQRRSKLMTESSCAAAM